MRCRAIRQRWNGSGRASMAFRHSRCAFHLANLPELGCEAEFIERAEWQRNENADPLGKQPIRLLERQCDFGWIARRFCGIGNAPMCCHRLTRPYRADFPSGVVAYGKDKIEFRFFEELDPRL